MLAFPPDSRFISAEKIEDISYQHLADQVPTPFYAYSASQIRADFSALKNSLPDDIHYFYSLKANPNKALVRLLNQAGTGCEVCSLAELETVLSQGVEPQDIIFVGPGKYIAELTQCCRIGIKAVVIESIEEMKLLNDIAASMGVIQTIALRINPDFIGEKAKLVMSGKPRQFGIDEQLLPQAFSCVGQQSHLRLAGIHIYLGTRILDWQALAKNTLNILSLAESLQNTYKIHFDFVDVGGGFGVRYFDKEKALDIDSLGDALTDIIRTYHENFPRCKIIVELGRYLIARAGVFVTRVNYLKPSRDEWFAVCDGGANCHGSAAGINSLIRRNFPMARLGETRSDQQYRYQVTGPLCTPTDLLGENVMLAELRPGDLIGIGHSGAYGASASPVNFLGFGHPAEILVEKDQAFLIRTADNIETLLAPQICQPLSVANA
ncbi:diaminopimelate decarboxylase [Rahnella perminowiae]|uniref:diaminopimelate decarboxylase n=1 Tax=Rahnella perminowiae TaxID=2816244 RepID=UPI001C27F8B9|nr:diaminopimelate decarboxylase [Rahnella perminowiae]MBU9825180.1 diaminopimelate decarboxylase [Rahnella perminowiae]